MLRIVGVLLICVGMLLFGLLVFWLLGYSMNPIAPPVPTWVKVVFVLSACFVPSGVVLTLLPFLSNFKRSQRRDQNPLISFVEPNSTTKSTPKPPRSKEQPQGGHD